MLGLQWGAAPTEMGARWGLWQEGRGLLQADPQRPNNSNYPGSTHSAALRGMTQHGSTDSRLVPNCLTKHS